MPGLAEHCPKLDREIHIDVPPVTDFELFEPQESAVAAVRCLTRGTSRSQPPPCATR